MWLVANLWSDIFMPDNLLNINSLYLHHGSHLCKEVRPCLIQLKLGYFYIKKIQI